jgi:phenylpropionate dioxygenase-like ring-hydroxylating dioxygenase large terminal subunit
VTPIAESPAAASSVLHSPIPLEEFAPSTLPVRQARSLPPACYTSSAFYEYEREVIFAREWLCVGRAEQLPEVGDYLALTVADEPIVVLRDRDGEIAAMSAVCQHRGVPIVEGSGNCGRFLRCPYHWWTYDLTGRLVAAPQMHEAEGFDKADVALPRLQVEVWNGFVFVNFDETAAPLAPRLARLDALLTNYHVDQLVTTEQEISHHDFNWKIMVENGIEPYHATYLHHRMVEAPKERNYEDIGREEHESFVVSLVNHGFYDAALNPTYQSYFPPIETLTDQERRRFGFASVLPNLMLGWQSDMMFWFLLLPSGPERVDFRWAYLLPASTRQVMNYEMLLAMTRDGVASYNAEDLPIAEAMQRGMRSRYAPRGRYSHEEEVLTQFNRWLVSRYAAAEQSFSPPPPHLPLEES